MEEWKGLAREILSTSEQTRFCLRRFAIELEPSDRADYIELIEQVDTWRTEVEAVVANPGERAFVGDRDVFVTDLALIRDELSEYERGVRDVTPRDVSRTVGRLRTVVRHFMAAGPHGPVQGPPRGGGGQPPDESAPGFDRA